MSYYDKRTESLFCQYCGRQMRSWVDTRDFGWRLLEFNGVLHSCPNRGANRKQAPVSLGEDLSADGLEE